MFDKGGVRASDVQCALERPDSLFCIWCRTSFTNQLEQRRRIEAFPIHESRVSPSNRPASLTFGSLLVATVRVWVCTDRVGDV